MHTQRWARHFSCRGWNVTVVSLEPGEIEGVNVIPVCYTTVSRPISILLGIWKAASLIKALKPDILHAHYVTSYGLAGAMTGRHPFIATAWGSDILVEPEKSWLYRRMVSYSLSKADLVTSMASHMTELMVQRGYAKPDRIITLPFGVDTTLFNPEKRTMSHRRKPCLIVSTRRLEKDLDVDVFIKAIPGILQREPEARFSVVGDGTFRKDLEALARKIGVDQYVKFMGEVSQSVMAELLGRADIFVSTSPSDGNNISLNEAMACGAFPVATDIVANRAWIQPDQNGVLFRTGDSNSLADSITDVLENPARRQAAMRENWEIVRTKASWDNSMATIEDHYYRLLDKDQRRGNGTI